MLFESSLFRRTSLAFLLTQRVDESSQEQSNERRRHRRGLIDERLEASNVSSGGLPRQLLLNVVDVHFAALGESDRQHDCAEIQRRLLE